MSEQVIPTGRGRGVTGIRLSSNGWDDYDLSDPDAMFSIHVRDIDGKESSASTQRNLFLDGVSEFFDVDIAPRPKIVIRDNWFETNGTEEPETAFPQVGDTVEAYWQLERAKKADAVLLDRDGDVWAQSVDPETGLIDYAPAIHDQEPNDSPDSLYVTDLFPANVIYIRGNVPTY